MKKEEYTKYVQQTSKKSPLLKDCINAFLYGGAICTVGQGFSNLYKSMGLSKEAVSSAVSVTMIFWGVFLTAIGVYWRLAKHAGAGTIIPITGFANSIVSPAIEFKSEGLVLGVGAKMFVIAGPVLVYGILTSFIYGIILYILQKV
ncbi:MAG: stage V sporulation protein AC [Bacillota bacterium]|nr:stage V sporulation protein AC [Bacillota bacterium]